MNTPDMIAFIALTITIISLLIQQTRIIIAEKKRETRTANKLKIFYLCQDRMFTEMEILAEYQKANPTEKIDHIEIRKTIYEMLTDETLNYRHDGTYRAKRYRPKIKNKQEQKHNDTSSQRSESDSGIKDEDS